MPIDTAVRRHALHDTDRRGAAGLLVAIRPDIGGYVVALWLAGIIVNLLLLGSFYDVALRDFGLLIAALALARLASASHRSKSTGSLKSSRS